MMAPAKEAKQGGKAKRTRISKSLWHEHVLQHLYVWLAAYYVGWTVHRLLAFHVQWRAVPSFP